MSTNALPAVKRASAPGRIKMAAAGIGIVGVTLAGTATPAESAPERPSCRAAQFTHGAESRVVGDIRYWFPATSWTACNAYGGGLANTTMGHTFHEGAGRGYYHRGGGTWGWGTATVKFTGDNYSTIHNVIYDLKTTTRFNHGHTYRYSSVRNGGYQ